jgi:hypothetical protein
LNNVNQIIANQGKMKKQHKSDHEEIMIKTSKEDLAEDDGFDMMTMFAANKAELIATDGAGVEPDSENSFEYDVQLDDIYDLTVF